MLAALDRHLHENGAKFSVSSKTDTSKGHGRYSMEKLSNYASRGKVKERIKQMQSQHLRKNSSGPGR